MAQFEFDSASLTFKVGTDANGFIASSGDVTAGNVFGTKNISFEYINDQLTIEQAETLITSTLADLFDWSADILSAKYRKVSSVTSGTPVEENTKNQTDTETISNSITRYSTLEVVFGFANGSKGSFAVRPFDPSSDAVEDFKSKVKAFTATNLINNGLNNSCTGIVEAYITTQTRNPIIDDPSDSSVSGGGVDVMSIQIKTDDAGTSRSKTFSNINANASDSQIAGTFNALYDLTTLGITSATAISRREIDLTKNGGES